jgi:hypothetical protein
LQLFGVERQLKFASHFPKSVELTTMEPVGQAETPGDVIMSNRSLLGALMLVGALIPVTSCSNNPSLTSISIRPTSYTALLGPCGTQQVVASYTATGTYTRPGHAAVTQDITDSVTWFSYDTQLVTVSSTGVASVVTCANPAITFTSSTIITASAHGFHGLIVGTATFNEQEPPVTPAVVKSLSISRISGPASTLGGVAQFVAVGKTEDGVLVPLTGKTTWSSSNPQAIRVDANTGVARTMTANNATVTATYTNPDGDTVKGTVDFGPASEN